MERKIRWGIIGPGNIAHKFASDLQLVPSASISAVASRSLERAESFADAYGIAHVFESYEALFASDTVDVVYIATPHNFHKGQAIQAMEQGIHVLCEKPLAMNRAEVEEIIQAAQRNKVFMMEVLWSRFNPLMKEVKGRIDSGDIGDVSFIYADFAFYGMDYGEDSRVLNLDLASGSVLDIGIYPIFLAYLILGMPTDVLATSKFHSNGTEIQTSMIFQYPEAQAVLYSGITSNTKMEAKISGTQGEILMGHRWHEANDYTLVKEHESHKKELPKQGNGYTYQILEVHDCLMNNRLESNLWSHQNSLDLVDLMDLVRSKAGIRYPFEA